MNSKVIPIKHLDLIRDGKACIYVNNSDRNATIKRTNLSGDQYKLIYKIKKMLIISVILLNILGSYSCDVNNFSYKIIENKILTLVKKSKTSKRKYEILDMRTIFPFQWDTLYVFDEYTDAKTINEVTSTLTECSNVSSNYKRMVFKKNNVIINYIDYRYDLLPIYVFSCNDHQFITIPKNEAVFTVFKSCNSLGFLYPLIPISCLKNININTYLYRNCP